VRTAHDGGLWIRFYTLNGHDPADVSGGWSASYNFGSLGAARERWRAAIMAGVDFVAVDQYEEFAKTLRSESRLFQHLAQLGDNLGGEVDGAHSSFFPPRAHARHRPRRDEGVAARDGACVLQRP
jgi:hypothetical protein